MFIPALTFRGQPLFVVVLLASYTLIVVACIARSSTLDLEPADLQAMRIVIFFVVAFMTFTGRAEQPVDKGTRWIQRRPHAIVWSSKGSSRILQDYSVELAGPGDWQEFTLYFQFPKPATVKRIRLELLPSVSSAPPDKARMLFEVKPHLKNHDGETTGLEFEDCRFLGQLDDDTTANCIDCLPDTGWKVPDSVGDDSSHQLVLQFAEPIEVNIKTIFGITIDSGGSRELGTLSRIRISFAGPIPKPNQNSKAVNQSTHSRGD